MKKLILFVSCLIVALLVNAQTPTFQWAKHFGGNGIGATNTGNGITVDLFGNVYTTGAFSGTADFDPGISVYNMTAIGSSNIFISKLDASGNFLWAKRIGNSSYNSGSAISLGISNSIYITGYFNGTVDFDPGPGTSNLTSNGSDDIFILKLDTLGNFIWVKRIGGANGDYGASIALDTLENIYVTGRFCFGSVDFDPGIGVFNLNGIANDNIFVAKYNSSGSFVWAKYLGDGGEGYGSEIILDDFNNVFTTGTFRGLSSDFDPNAGTYILNTGGYSGVFISKLTSAGNFVWAKQLSQNNNTYGHAYGYAIDLDAAGNIYTTGTFSDTVDFNPGTVTYYLSSATQNQKDCFISKLSPSGSFIWARKIGAYHDTPNENEGRSVAIDDTGNVYITGKFGDTLDFDPGIGVYNMIGGGSNGFSDGFVLKLNPSGNFVWARQFNSSGRGNSIVIDPAENIYMTGQFGGTVDFDFGPSVYNLTAFTYDIFVHKMGSCTPPAATITPIGPTTFCSPGSVTLNANTSAGITYLWYKNGVSLVGATSSSYVAITTGSYTCFLTNSCGAVTSNSIQVTVSTAVPATPGSITTIGGVVKVCPGENRTYTVTAVTGVTYTWTPCAGSVITNGQGTNSVTVQYNANFPTSDTLRVIATNSCGNSAQRKLKISRNTPGTPAAITGNNFGVCNLNGISFSVTNVVGMTYSWSFNTGTATVASGQGTSSITTNYGAGFVSGSLSVTANNGCGASAARLKTIYAKPATPVSITGATSVCLNQQNVPYSIAPLANVTNYTWTGPTGSHISDGITTSSGTTLITTHTSVTVNFATTAGAVKVRGNNSCASGSYKTLSITIVCREGEFSNQISETRIFPNPASTNFTLETDDTTPFDIEVYDAYGRLIFSEVNVISGNRVNTNGWADGLYSVIVRKENNSTTHKLMIHELK